MENSRVDRFNIVVGNAPSGDYKEVIDQIRAQCSFLIEEVSETFEAAKENNIVEIVDGIADIEYVAAYLKTLIKSLGVNQEGAFLAVCDNNDEKFTKSKELAEKWQSEKDFLTFIAEVEYEGDTYYTVRRVTDRKVMKYEGFPKVDLTPYIPQNLLKG